MLLWLLRTVRLLLRTVRLLLLLLLLLVVHECKIVHCRDEEMTR